ncbi:hypothetical protein ATZ33_07995 [Enterococcus silesiacus]|uniref:Uncharacterized protein n=1 Tax=Enterococcus silesiacus TaxID=332949 RepID=A0A0S3KAP1_9ENTE|nr:type IV secretory system conjugative DNA transfer family protein [Enterococcus silesiacus]ALS01310.1 hypothetical protein ATZ33_07995 [Enterococcus silesiacus]OJG90706.1 hypothetical protein RV15_GL001057 [Enterococcus silesiacus]
MRKIENLTWHKLSWTRPIEFENIQNLVHHLAVTEKKPVAYEIRATSGKITYFLGTEKDEFAKIQKIFKTHGVDFGAELVKDTTTRKPIKVARKLSIAKPILSLKTDNANELTRIMTATIAQASPKDEIVIQLLVASSLPPEHLPNKNVPDPHASWWQIISNGNPPVASSDTRTAIKNKIKSHRLRTMIRIGASCKDEAKARSYILSVLSAFRMLEAGGNKLNLQPEDPLNIDMAKLPWKYSKLSVPELANFMIAPIGQEDLSGITPIHPKLLLPPLGMKDPPKNQARAFGTTLNENSEDRRLLHLSANDARTNTFIVGSTGSGKSVILENLCLADAQNGHGFVLLDVKQSLVESVAERLPEHRLKDCVVLEIGGHNPIGINPLQFIDGKNSEIVAESVLSALRGLFPEFGVFTEELLTTGLLTLAQSKNMTLLHLPILFTNASFRHKVTSKLTDIYLKSYWANFEAMPEKERKVQLGALNRRLNVLLMRPALRNLLGQPHPKFNLEDVFDKNENTILLIPLNSGIVGETAAELVGSLVINLLWNIILKRTEQPEKDRKPVMVYIDEFHSFLKYSEANFQQMLEMCRSLGVGYTLVCQNLGQLSKELKEVVFANAKSKIIFSVPNKRDAVQFADLTASQLSEIDFTLPQFRVYATLNRKDIANVWLSGKTFPSKPSKRLPIEVFARSAEKYGRDIAEIEKEYIDLMTQNDSQDDGLNDLDIDLIIGKKPKKKADN